MRKKDYELIASVIKQAYNRELEIEQEGNDTKTAQASLEVLSWRMADELQARNPKFNWFIFMKACGINPKGNLDKFRQKRIEEKECPKCHTEGNMDEDGVCGYCMTFDEA